MKALLGILPILVCLGGLPGMALGTEDRWIDALSLTAGKDDKSNDTDVYRFGVQNRWNRTWFNDGAWYLGGYWDAALAYWDADTQSNRSLYDLSLTPILRLQRDASLSRSITPFSEIGVGGHLLSDKEIGDRDLSTNFQFGSHLGVGLGFGDKGRYELMYRYQHLSNADIEDPNQGINLHLVSFGYVFE
jgi:lipid A 3-O-deacylase